MNRQWSWIAGLGLLAALGHGGSRAAAADPPPRDLEASLGLLPGLVDSAEEGALIDLVRAMDAVYPGHIHVQVFPMERSIHNLLSGKADFHLPALRDAEVSEDKLLFGVADETIGTLSNVLYSNVHKPLTRSSIDAALARGGEFPYLLEAVGGDEAVSYPYKANNQIHLSLKKLNAGRIDGVINPQEEADAVIAQWKLKNIHRALYATSYDIVAIPKGEAGAEVNRIVSQLIRTLRESGELERLYSKIHRPYSGWQPAAAAW